MKKPKITVFNQALQSKHKLKPIEIKKSLQTTGRGWMTISNCIDEFDNIMLFRKDFISADYDDGNGKDIIFAKKEGDKNWMIFLGYWNDGIV